MRGPDSIELSQKKLFAALKADLSYFEKRKNKEIASYERAFRRFLPKRPKASTKKDLLKSIANASVVLVGDFHPFRQSQKGFLRLVEEVAPTLPRPVIGLECLQSDHQQSIDEYLANSITAEELREQLDFERHWPFPWESYREILSCARRLTLPVLALNIPETTRSSRRLRERDHAAAQRLAEELALHPESTIFVLYGELHLARPHLPGDLRRLLGRETRLLVVHQNDPNLYWQASKLKNGQKPEVLRLSKEEFCILNSVPWVKLRSYLDWLEGNPGQNEADENLDVAGTVHHYAELLAEACGLKAGLTDELEIIGPDQLTLAKAKGAERAGLSHALRFHRTAYLPKSRLLVLPSVSTNALSEAASHLLWHSLGGQDRETGSDGPVELVSHFLVGYLGSKVLNPKRKCNEVQDLKAILTEARRKTKTQAKARVVRRALSLLLKLLAKNPRVPGAAGALPGASEIEACRLTGFVLGERLFLALLRDNSLLPLVQSWYRTNSPAEFRELLAETGARIASRPTASKHEKF